MTRRKPVLLIHGGAGAKTPSLNRDLIVSSLEWIVVHAYAQLFSGASAVDTVTEAVRLLEDDPLFNAGKGSKIQADGRIRMSASLMDGKKGRFAGCINVERVKNPVAVARLLLNQEDRVLSGTGALKFARAHELTLASPFTAERRREFRAKKSGRSGTVGAVALDKQGRLAAATSTGGRGYEEPCRVSDSATVAGNFANANCAVSATGTGEQIVDYALAATLCAYLDAGLSLKEAGAKLIDKAKSKRAQFGFIALGRDGEFIMPTTTRSMSWAAATAQGIFFFEA